MFDRTAAITRPDASSGTYEMNEGDLTTEIAHETVYEEEGDYGDGEADIEKPTVLIEDRHVPETATETAPGVEEVHDVAGLEDQYGDFADSVDRPADQHEEYGTALTEEEAAEGLDADEVHPAADAEEGGDYTDYAGTVDDDDERYGEELPEELGGGVEAETEVEAEVEAEEEENTNESSGAHEDDNGDVVGDETQYYDANEVAGTLPHLHPIPQCSTSVTDGSHEIATHVQEGDPDDYEGSYCNITSSGCSNILPDTDGEWHEDEDGEHNEDVLAPVDASLPQAEADNETLTDRADADALQGRVKRLGHKHRVDLSVQIWKKQMD